MKRIHFIEIHEQPWCPVTIREGSMDCLRVLATVGQQFKNTAPLIVNVLGRVETNRIIDLCSGGGGPWPTLANRINRQKPCRVTLTDLFPTDAIAEQLAEHPRIDVHLASVDAMQVPAELTGLRTLFTALHHFTPEQAQGLLRDAVEQQQPIAMFEQTRRVWWALPIMLVTPLVAFLLTPFLRPFRVSRLFWTYIIPAIPFVLCFDGIVSCLRTYTLDEMQQMVNTLPERGFLWELGRIRSPFSPIGIQYLVGYPRAGLKD